MKNVKLYYIFLITFLLLTCSFSAYANSNEAFTANTFNRVQVFLKPNGTWEYFDDILKYADNDYIVMGNSAKVNDVNIFVNSARYEKNNDHTYLIVNCTIQNLSSIPIFISSIASFTLMDVKGYYQDLSLSANVDKSLDCRLMPKETVNGEIAYIIDPSNEIYWALSFNPNLINPGQVVFAIMKEQIK